MSDRSVRKFISRLSRAGAGFLAAALAFSLHYPAPGVTAAEAEMTEQTAAEDETTTISLLHKYDSTDVAVVRSVDRDAGTITLCQHELGRYYTLSVDNTSMIYDRYGRPITAGLLEPGEVVDATFLHQSRHLNSLIISDTAWVKEDVRNYSIDADNEIMTIDGLSYKFPRTALILNRENGIGERIIVEEILENDVLTVYGIDKEIYSVAVTSGHGYLKLTSSEVGGRDITGAWLNMDNRVIRRVESKMLVAAPEGEYTLQIIGHGANDSRPVTIERGKETVIDASTIQMEEPDMTEITFLVDPEDAQAKLDVDGKAVTPGMPVYLAPGVHRLKCTAEGYADISEYIKVGEKNANVRLELTKDTSAPSASSTEATTADAATTAYTDYWATTGYSGSFTGMPGMASTGASGSATAASSAASTGSVKESVTVVDISGNSTTVNRTTSITGYEVRVEAPVGVEFYLDDNYKGVTPLTFPKVSGQHRVTLFKDGYVTKGYNIYIDDAQSNKTYVFPDLVRIEDSK